MYLITYLKPNITGCFQVLFLVLDCTVHLCVAPKGNMCLKDAPSPSTFRTLSKQVLVCEIGLPPKIHSTLSIAQNRNVLCISSYMSSLAFVYLGREPHKQLDWSDKYPQQFFIMSGEHQGINVTPSSGKMVTFTLFYPVAFFFPDHLVYDSEWYLWKLSNLS